MTPIASDIKTIECLFVACIRHYFPRQGGNLNCAGFGLQSRYFRLAVLQLLILSSNSLNRLFVSDNRNLFHLLAGLPSFQCKHHIWSSFKIVDISFPTKPAFAMAQADKLLLHLPAAIWADPFTAHLCPSGWIMEASEQEIPYFRSNSRARVSPSWVI